MKNILKNTPIENKGKNLKEFEALALPCMKHLKLWEDLHYGNLNKYGCKG